MRKPWLWLLAATAAAQQKTKPVSDAEALVSLTGLFRRAPAKAAALVDAARRAAGHAAAVAERKQPPAPPAIPRAAPPPAPQAPPSPLPGPARVYHSRRPPPPAIPAAPAAAPLRTTPAIRATNRSRFSWRDAQLSFRRCMNGTTPEVRQDRYVYWSSSSALGNALNGWMHIFLYALASGRQPVAGKGAGPELLCGTHGAFICGIPYRSNGWVTSQTHRGIDGDWTPSEHVVHQGPLVWYRYMGASTSTKRGGKGTDRRRIVSCYGQALRCPSRKLDGESCLMVRAMQLLVPGSRLRPEFSSAALVEARRRWRGSLEEFQKVVAPRDWSHGDLVFYDGPLKEDIATRWEGGLHVRLQPPKLEGHHSDADFDDFIQRLTNKSFVDPLPKDFRRPSTKLWSCSAASARAHAEHAGVTSITSSFLATDTKGLCVKARQALVERNSSHQIACMDMAPVHLTRQTDHKPVSKGTDDGLDGHQAVILDWYLLQRSRWLAPVARSSWQCHHGARRDDTHGVDKPGASFYGWALAAAGLVPLGPRWPRVNCGCRVDSDKISVFALPRSERAG